MLTHRVIPCLLLQDGGLVKTQQFSSAKYVGDPINAVRIFNEKEVDELMILDIEASKVGRGPDFALIEQLASECFMPLCYGGGIRTLEDAQRLFRLGVEKVCVQTAAFRDSALIPSIATRYGEQAVVLSIDIRRRWLGAGLHNHSGVPVPKGPWLSVIQRMVASGVGEVLLNAVDRDGTLKGVDLDLISEVSQSVPVPVVAIGGVGSLSDIKAAVGAGASAVAAGAFFVFHGPHRAVLITYPRYTDLQDMWR
jgi:cyclase